MLKKKYQYKSCKYYVNIAQIPHCSGKSVKENRREYSICGKIEKYTTKKYSNSEKMT